MFKSFHTYFKLSEDVARMERQMIANHLFVGSIPTFIFYVPVAEMAYAVVLETTFSRFKSWWGYFLLAYFNKYVIIATFS
jgi:hypothetical protein